MTQIMSLAPRPRRPGELGMRSVDHFNFVRKVDPSRWFSRISCAVISVLCGV